MTRRKIGSRRRGRDSFVDDKTDAALFSVSELTETVRTKVMRPIGAGPLPPPHLVRNADLDPYIYEGIPWINRGRGIIDPTPGNSRPLNRRIRREFQADLGAPARTSAMRPSPMVTMSYADGPMAAMADPRNLSRPENVIPIDESSASINEIETRVDAILGPKPTTLKQATDNLKKLENIVNSGTPNGNNFKLETPYFASQMQPELAAVSPRFAGDNTPMSSYDYGVYYGVAANLLDYPEAFRDIHLAVAAANNPDSPTNDAVGGSALALPSYFSISQKSESVRGTTALGPVRAASGAKDMSSVKIDTLGGRTTTGGRLPIVIEMPIYKSDGQKGTDMAVSGSVAQLMLSAAGGQSNVPIVVGTTEPPADHVEEITEYLAFWERVLAKTGVARQPLMDSVSMSVLLGYMQEMQNLQGKISQLKNMTSQAPNPNALQSIRSLEQRMAELYSEAQEAVALATTMHEMGHLLDFVGEYKTSPDYSNAIATTSSGLNSEYELVRDLTVITGLKQGLDHPIKSDLADTLSRKFAKDKLLEMIAVISRLNSLPEVVAMAQVVGSDLVAMDPSIKNMLSPRASSGGQIDRLMAAFETLVNTDLSDINSRVMPGTLIAPFVNSGIFPQALISDPARLSQMAETAIKELKRIGEDSIVGVVGPGARAQYDFYKNDIEAIINAAEERIGAFPRPAQRAAALAATAVVVHALYLRGFNAFLVSTSNEQSDLVNKEQDLQFLADWFGNNVTQDDMDKALLDGGRRIMTDLLAANPGVVREFMEAYGSHKSKPWFDGNGAFDAAEYLKYILNGPNGLIGITQDSLVKIINHWYAAQGSNGWKNLSDEEIRLVQSAAAKLTDYGGPADYVFDTPLPKFQTASNKETYAELHPIILLKMERMLQKLTAEERRAVERLHEEMIANARAVINRTNQGGATP